MRILGCTALAFCLGIGITQAQDKPQLIQDPVSGLRSLLAQPFPPDSSGWRFAFAPRAASIDDRSGAVRFKINLNDTGQIDTLTVMESTVSAAQEKLCRQALLNARFERTGSKPKAATGFYTFRFTIRN
jgi:hypothetical protein